MNENLTFLHKGLKIMHFKSGRNFLKKFAGGWIFPLQRHDVYEFFGVDRLSTVTFQMSHIPLLQVLPKVENSKEATDLVNFEDE